MRTAAAPAAPAARLVAARAAVRACGGAGEWERGLAVAACRRQGLGGKAATLVEKMEAAGFEPDDDTLTNALSACSASAGHSAPPASAEGARGAWA